MPRSCASVRVRPAPEPVADEAQVTPSVAKAKYSKVPGSAEPRAEDDRAMSILPSPASAEAFSAALPCDEPFGAGLPAL